MSAFGRRNGTGNGNRPSFGVARPMKGPGPAIPDDGGSQFPPIDSVALPTDDGTPDGISGGGGDRGDAMARIDARQAAPMADASSRNEGFENSIHRIKEQVPVGKEQNFADGSTEWVGIGQERDAGGHD